MLSRLIPRSKFRFATLISSQKSLTSSSQSQSFHSLFSNPNFNFIYLTPRHFSTNRNNNGGDDSSSKPPSSIPNTWRFTPDNDEEEVVSIFDEDGGDDFTGFNNEFDNNRGGFNNEFDKKSQVKPSSSPSPSVGRSDVVNVKSSSWGEEDSLAGDVFGAAEKEFESNKNGGGGGDGGVIGGDAEWETAKGYKLWNFGDEEKEEEKTEIFDIGDGTEGIPFQIGKSEADEILEREKSEADEILEREKSEADQKLEMEKNELSVQLKGPNRAFGDLIAASGITDAMLDSLIALKDLEAVDGLPPLSEIEEKRLEKNEKKNDRAEIERQKLEEIAKSRIRKVDDKGRAYGTGRRKCSIARVFIQPGDGKFLVNDKQFDVYFPILDHRADLLRPFSETKTLGLWDVACTVKGGGVSGQVGAIRLGISRALQNWEPGLRPSLKAVGFLTRDSRVVERKKPGKAKARKSFQWVKR
ncbi:30S ribosomal protein S9 protein [Thalictrum thalictroides]|uniref:30S ribosomal protein S9 protein n=1 Tax=Thalictrum thalictroides TaxID=46969 RepID=A0A7J6WZV8_THATH|nr:30S ribosomal protein S9 protein [Thalictrum thalictroides]